MDHIWQLQDAKSKFSEVVDCALTQGTQIVTRRGIKTVAVISYEEYEKLTHPDGTLSNFLLASPLKGSELSIDRNRNLSRPIDIEP